MLSIPKKAMTSNREPEKRITITQAPFLSVTDVGAWGCFVTRDMSWGGGLNQAVATSAGDSFDDYVLESIFKPKVGEVFSLPAFSAPVDRIFLGILPEWRDGLFDEEQLLIRCYRNLMTSLSDNKTDSIALPSLGAGKRGFPQKRVVRLTLSAIIQNMPDTVEEIKIICRDDESFEAYSSKLNNLQR